MRRGLYSKYIKSSVNSIAKKKKKKNSPILQRARDLNEHYFKEDTQMANRYIKKKKFNITNHQGNANQNHN